MSHRLLLDASSLMYRAFHALPASIRDGAGRPVNAVHGYLDMTARLVSSRNPDHVTHVWDDEIAPEERLRAYPSYKMHRAPDPEGLPEQFLLLERVLHSFGAERARANGWEADDAIGALCAGAGQDDEVEIVTGDRDLLQLVRDRPPVVRVLFTVRGVSDLIRFDEAAVYARYGVPPARYVDFATLRGDPSDGLPGVKGIGEKTACALVNAYASLDDILNAGDLPPRIGARIRDSREYLESMRSVVPVRRDVPVSIDRGRADAQGLIALAMDLRLKGPIRRLARAIGLPLPDFE
jgi:5'-3' exonuclease